MTEKPVIVVVEDDEDTGSQLLKALAELPQEIVDMYGIQPKEFEVIWLHTGREAVQWLSRAASGRVIVLVLDLELPDDPGKHPSTDIGRNILRDYSRTCVAVLVHTRFTDLRHVRAAILAGSAGYALKGFSGWDPIPPATNEGEYRRQEQQRREKQGEFLRCVVEAYRKGLERRWTAIRDAQSNRWRLVQACARVADNIAGVVNDATGIAQDHLRSVVGMIRERYQIDLRRDRDDPLAVELCRLREAIDETWRRSSATQRPSQTPDKITPDKMIPVCIEDLLNGLVSELQSGFAYHRLEWKMVQSDEARHCISVFRQDLETILREMIFNAVEAARAEGAFGEVEHITAQVAWAEDRYSLTVAVTDTGSSLSEEVRSRVNDGEPFAPEDGRAFGLSLAQRVAHSMGAHLEIRALGEWGNQVALHLPGEPMATLISR